MWSAALTTSYHHQPPPPPTTTTTTTTTTDLDTLESRDEGEVAIGWSMELSQ